AGLLIMASCKKEEVGPVLDQVSAPVLTAPAPGALITLTEENAATLMTFEWSAADYGFQAAVTYTVQLDQAGNDFATPVDLLKNTKLSGAISYGDLNNLLIAGGYPDGVPSDLEIRVKSYISDKVDDLFSDPVTVGIQPYMVTIDYPVLHVPGSYQGWDPSDENTVIYSLKSDNQYEGYVYFADPNTEFKYTQGTTWAVNWGDTGADGTLDSDGDNIKAADAGMYKLNVDLTNLTHTFLKTDWGLIGSATPGGWDSDQDMDWDAENSVLTITLDLVAGDIKFRANDDWAINLGDNDTNKSLEYEGDNIPVAENGNYTITLDLSGPIYTYTVTKN
ncbi:MAG: SusE domain-containing protein, partial [Bacteroidales bacterium]|nr:SusE domain-containing protein [Bacteroidales bacterium]